ncbi:Odorant-binding protein 56e [Drosophila willistoni]|uniref:Odorant-binding protein 56e n=1 Tax=Drosophila willistoni TaxID=7260 RepID=B4MRU1_DROWI|nr:general odorant-binding protein 56d [Drosophila willistoni]EDW74830.1 Odorant-binding protein 56e [Drosophila willistoni]
MKYLIVVVAFVALASANVLKVTDEQKLAAIQRAKECGQQEGISREQALALRAGNFEDTDPKVKCFANCFLEKSGFVVDGNIKPDVVLAKLGPIAGEDKIKEIQGKCDSLKGADKCDTSYQLYKCYSNNRAQI